MTNDLTVRNSVAIADPNNPSNVLVPNAQNAAAVTKSDATIHDPPFMGLYIGGAGDIAVRMFGSQNSVTFVAVPVGTLLPISVDKILSTGTSATNIVGLY